MVLVLGYLPPLWSFYFFLCLYNLQYDYNDSNNDGAFVVADSNSFMSP